MVVELAVENFAIIERAQLTLGPGFTVLTGETGAGKSLLVDAIELALGDRADTELVRAGATRASVSLTVDLTNSKELREKCTELGLALEDGLLYIQREVFVEGRSQCRVCGRLIPVSSLKSLGELLVDLHGQHDHQSLLNPDRHVGFLDAWIGEPAAALLAKVAEAFAKAEDVRRRLAALKTGLRDREQRLDLLRYQVQEIESAGIKPGEMIELEIQLSRLKNAENLSTAMLSALDALADREDNAEGLVGGAVRTLEDAAKLDPSIEPALILIREAYYDLEEGARQLRSNAESLESDPAKLEEVAGRIDLLKRLRRKYGEDEAAVLEFWDTAQQELELLEDAEANAEGLEEALAAANTELESKSAELTNLRKQKAELFAALVEAELKDLAMEKAVFKVQIGGKAIDASGADKVEFFFSANQGEPAKPLAKIASGGEISRVMLAIKAALAGKAGVPTLIFDEVDAGLGGRAAAVVAKKLEQLAVEYQILVISHLPQIASRATCHYRIEKSEVGGRILTGVRLLAPDERVEEIARMLAGENVSESALANARELLAGV